MRREATYKIPRKREMGAATGQCHSAVASSTSMALPTSVPSFIPCAGKIFRALPLR